MLTRFSDPHGLGKRRVRVEIERFPDTGELPLRAPRRRPDALVAIDDAKASLTLHDVRRHEAYRLRLLDGDRPGISGGPGA